MGEAIARLCEAARHSRELSDAAYYCPETGTAGELRFFLEGIAEAIEFLNSGKHPSASYIHDLGKYHACPIEPAPDDDGERGWLVSAHLPNLSELHRLAAAALGEALSWGQLAPTIEGHIGRLLRAAEDVQHEVKGCKVRWAEAPKVASRGKKGGLLDAVFEEMKRQPSIDHARYAVLLERWFEAYGALSRFAEEPPAPTVPPEKQTGSKPRGRQQNDEALARDLLAGWRAFEPEEGRKTKPRYLAQRDDVRALKTEDARQRRIDSLLVALNSALHLKREKTKQRRRLRG